MEHISNVMDRILSDLIEHNAEQARKESEERMKDVISIRVIGEDQDPNDPEEWDEDFIVDPSRIFKKPESLPKTIIVKNP